jgi:ACS family hexuronate transporter-like MFS transporter
MRWTILSLLFAATTINYLDRALLGTLLPEIRKQFDLPSSTYGNIQSFFQIAYALGSLLAGRLLDRFGTRIGYGLSAALWSAAAMLNAFARSAVQFALLRWLLGLGESANFPACNKGVAEWFPPEQRATSMGILNFGTSFANIIGPPMFIWLALRLSWQACFAIMGGLGFVWLPVWFIAYRATRKTKLPVQEGAKVPMKQVLKHKEAWGYAWAKFLTDGVWWFYLFWLPLYLSDVLKLTPQERGWALSLIYAISGVGSLLGGFASSALMKRGWQVGRARKTAMLVCVLAMPLLGVFVVSATGWIAVVTFGLLTAAHQAWMANLFTTPSDSFPKQAVASVNGFGVCLGGLGGALFASFIPGYVIPLVGYGPLFVILSCFYPVAWFIVHKMMGDMEQIRLEVPVELSMQRA